MKYIWVLVDKETGNFWKNTKKDYYSQPKRAVQAYTSEARALAALANFHPKVEPNTVVVNKFREITQ